MFIDHPQSDTVLIKSAWNPLESTTVTLSPIWNVRQTALATFLCSFLFCYKMHTPIIQHRKKEKQKTRRHVDQTPYMWHDNVTVSCPHDEGWSHQKYRCEQPFKVSLIYLSLSKVSWIVLPWQVKAIWKQEINLKKILKETALSPTACNAPQNSFLHIYSLYLIL